MKKENRKMFYIGSGALVLFIIWTLTLSYVDVAPIGPRGTRVGYATLNNIVRNITGVNMLLYNITDWLGLVPISFVIGFGILGIIRWIKRKNIFLVDFDIIVLGVLYVVMIAIYFLFEKYIVNYRPILINGLLEASYPSSTTLISMCVMPTASMVLNRRIKNNIFKYSVNVIITIFTAFMVIGRLISGVHWFSDIIGGLMLSCGLVVMYYAVVHTKEH